MLTWPVKSVIWTLPLFDYLQSLSASFVISLQHCSTGAKEFVLFTYLYIGFLMFLLPVCVN